MKIKPVLSWLEFARRIQRLRDETVRLATAEGVRVSYWLCDRIAGPALDKDPTLWAYLADRGEPHEDVRRSLTLEILGGGHGKEPPLSAEEMEELLGF